MTQQRPDMGLLGPIINQFQAVAEREARLNGQHEPTDPEPPEQQPDSPEHQQDARIAFAADRIRINEAARQLVDAENAGPAAELDIDTVAAILARPKPPPHRIAQLIPSEAGALLIAQRKVGKTTFELNYARSLVTGEPFLGRFDVRPIDGDIALLNLEVSAWQIAAWARDVGHLDHRLRIVNLRGRRNPFRHPADLDRLAGRLRGAGSEAVLCDTFGRAYTGKSQNDLGEVTAWLAELDQFTRSGVGATDQVLAAHAGWNGERTRGSSALDDWADTIITLTIEPDPDADKARYMRAFGRDVDLDEDQLHYDQASRQLTLSGIGSRRTAVGQRTRDRLRTTVLELVDAQPDINGTGVETELRERGVAFQKGEARTMLKHDR